MTQSDAVEESALAAVREEVDRPAGTSSETLEDYTLRYAPSTYRRWKPATVSITALGGIAYLADFAIGGSLGLTYGTGNALLAILVGAVIIFVTGVPLALYGSKYNIDLDLVTRGSGFGYYGSVITNLSFASFTIIFFALEGSIMAQGLHRGLHIPLRLGYFVSAIMIIPIVIFGMAALSKMQLWTTPLWLVLMVGPFVYLVASDPSSVSRWFGFHGTGSGAVSLSSIGLGAGVALSLMGQIGEQVDYLRFMPKRTAENKRAWYAAVYAAGPGWVIIGAIKQAAGAFLAVYVLASVGSTKAGEPVEQFVGTFKKIVPAWLALTLAVILVVLSQVKINATNAYSGSLAWTNSTTRLAKRYPKRITFVFVNVGIALILMEANMFASLNSFLGFYSNCAIAWVATVAADISINKFWLKISPKEPEFRRAYLYPVNPVGVGSFLLASGVSIAAYFKVFGEGGKSWSPFIALGIAIVATPLLALLTRSKYYIRRPDTQPEPRFDEDGFPTTTALRCGQCGDVFERPDMVDCPFHQARLCSLCCTTDRSCNTVCHEEGTAAFLGIPTQPTAAEVEARVND